MRNTVPKDAPEMEALEQREWRESLDYVIQTGDRGRVQRLLASLRHHARMSGVALPFTAVTAYVNSIRAEEETPLPGSQEIERRIKSLVRWNAMAMVVRGNRHSEGIGGHISTYASAATLYEVGFNHFFRGKKDGDGDIIYFQGHASPGIYARAFLEGRISAEQLHNFRRELSETGGLSSYPHPWLMPDFWEFPTVSMGLGPIMSIYQARFQRYLEDRGLKKPSKQKVWAFLGDGETDEPEALGAISLAAREKLENLIFVINCNLQRLDGPVRGNGQIIQELEAVFRGAGWNVIKVIWGSDWDPLLAKDHDGLLAKRMGSRRRAVPEIRGRERRLPARAFLRHRSAAARHGQAPLGRSAEEAAPRRPRSGEGLQRLQGGSRAHRAADGDPRPHDQGLRSRRSG
jgi:pyruvate dehydrogenase E1 component